jgi:hypothetical protein
VLLPRAITLAVAASLIAPAAGLHAQEPAPAPQAPDTSVKGYAPAAAAAEPVPAAAAAAAVGAPVTIGAQLGFVDVLPPRPPEKINSLLASAAGLEAEAGVELASAMSEKEKTKELVESKKQEISTIDGKRKLAEKTKQEGERIALEAEKKDAERQKVFLERRLDLHEAEIDRAKAVQKLAASMTRALQLEHELAIRRAGRAQTAGVDPTATRRQDAVILELEARALDAKRLQAEAEKQVADKDVDLARRRIDLNKAQVAAAGGQ